MGHSPETVENAVTDIVDAKTVKVGLIITYIIYLQLLETVPVM